MHSQRRDTRFKYAQKLQTLMAIQASKTCKIWTLLNPSMCYTGCFWDTGRYFIIFPWIWQSSLNGSLSRFFIACSKIPPFLPAAFPPFYSVILGSWGTIDSPILLPRYQSPFCAHHPEGWVFLCFSYFPPFGAVSSKAHG